MTLIDMLPEKLRDDLKHLPAPDDYIIQVLKHAVDEQKKLAKISSVRGKYKAVPTSSDAFARSKNAEIQMER